MLDFEHLGKYRENNRIEAKKALGGLPRSIWETYSAFANTMGGIILLGVVENPDKSLQAVDLPDPDALIREFWEHIRKPHLVSANILSEKHVQIEVVDGNHIIAITVPRAQRQDKPVYIDGNPLRGTYRRSGEGDYRCTKEEVQAMMRDASFKTQDMKLLEDMDLDVFDYDSVARYRSRMEDHRPGHTWENLDHPEFLYKLGAAGRGKDGKLHPTAAGLLMFGHANEIVREYPQYLLEYQEWPQSVRITSDSGDWSGNVHDFYFRVYDRIAEDIHLPFETEGGDTPIHSALREALANCLVHADYHGQGGLTIVKQPDSIVISNPGGFRIDIAEAVSGGVSDPRNAMLVKMFNMINIGRRVGSGIPGIYELWQKQGWKEPVIAESFDPERISLVLSMEVEETAQPSSPSQPARKMQPKSILHWDAVISYLTMHATAQCSDLESVLDLRAGAVRKILNDMIDAGIIVAEGSARNRIYRLRS